MVLGIIIVVLLLWIIIKIPKKQVEMCPEKMEKLKKTLEGENKDIPIMLGLIIWGGLFWFFYAWAFDGKPSWLSICAPALASTMLCTGFLKDYLKKD